jgi:hypothetical protein
MNKNVIHQEIDTLAEISPAVMVKETKKHKLKELGFNQSSELSDAKIDKESEARAYYKLHYPKCQYLTVSQFNGILNKYHLNTATLGAYIGFVPQKQLDLIAEFKLRDEDKIDSIYTLRSNFENVPFIKVYTGEKPSEGRIREDMYRYYGVNRYNSSVDYTLTSQEFNKLLIAATPNLIDYSKDKTETIEHGHFEKVIDPIVFQPVNKGGYLIISKWGEESADPLLNDCPFEEGTDEWANWMIENNV